VAIASPGRPVTWRSAGRPDRPQSHRANHGRDPRAVDVRVTRTQPGDENGRLSGEPGIWRTLAGQTQPYWCCRPPGTGLAGRLKPLWPHQARRIVPESVSPAPGYKETRDAGSARTSLLGGPGSRRPGIDGPAGRGAGRSWWRPVVSIRQIQRMPGLADSKISPPGPKAGGASEVAPAPEATQSARDGTSGGIGRRQIRQANGRNRAKFAGKKVPRIRRRAASRVLYSSDGFYFTGR